MNNNESGMIKIIHDLLEIFFSCSGSIYVNFLWNPVNPVSLRELPCQSNPAEQKREYPFEHIGISEISSESRYFSMLTK